MSTILAVDDNPQVRSWLRGLLDAERHQVAEARDGNEGLACFHRTHLDLLVLDIYMPERDGLEAILLLRRSWPYRKRDRRLRCLPIGESVRCSGCTGEALQSEGFRERVERRLNAL